MATQIRPGWVKWSGTRDVRGHREYKLMFLVDADTALDGPETVLSTPGFPQPGDFWIFGNDADLWAWCRWGPTSVRLKDESDPAAVQVWECELTFSTAPDEAYCRTTEQEDPLLEPVKLSGTSCKYNQEATFDIFGDPIVNSSWEQIRGPGVEFDLNRSTVHIEFNVAQLQLDLCTPLVNCVNADEMWGAPPRCVKLSKFDWEKKYYGPCSPYFTWKFDFDVLQAKDRLGNIIGFDREVFDEGTKVLNGHWDPASTHWVLDPIGGQPPDLNNPQHFIRFQDRKGNNARVILDGFGEPADVPIGTGSGTTIYLPGYTFIQYYPGVDFSVLGIPMTL